MSRHDDVIVAVSFPVFCDVQYCTVWWCSHIVRFNDSSRNHGGYGGMGKKEFLTHYDHGMAFKTAFPGMQINKTTNDKTTHNNHTVVCFVFRCLGVRKREREREREQKKQNS